MDVHEVVRQQQIICARYGAEWQPLDFNLKLGASANLTSGAFPLNGLRHPPEGSTCGWYLWAGEELSEANDFFQPLHARHLFEICPKALPYLGLSPGWRFLIAPDYEDVWYDPKLFDI